MKVVNRFIELFRGRGDAYGSWNGRAIREQLTPEHFKRHLTGTTDADWIGVYPHLGGVGKVTWGCIDIDGKDFDHDWDRMGDLAHDLATMLAVKDIKAYTERTRNGIHLWVFPETGMAPAADMRRALMAACKAIGYDPKEVNPKQEELAPGKLGNYVRLPYYGAIPRLASSEWDPDRYFYPWETDGPNSVGRYDLGGFLDVAERTSLAALAEVAALWTPPERQTFDGPPPEDVKAVLTGVGPLSYRIWKEGPLEGRDRSNTLAKLAYRLADDGVAMPAAFSVVKDADRRWGKFFDRPDCDEQIMGIVERAYS